MFKRVFFILAAAVIAVSGMSGAAAVAPEYLVPELTPAQKEADFRYLTDLVRDQWPFATYNVEYKGLVDLNAKAEEYIARAGATENNVQFYALFREYIQELHQTGHAYPASSPDTAATLDNPTSRFLFKLEDKAFARANYWWMYEQSLSRPYHAPLDVFYQGGHYVVLADYARGETNIPAGAIVTEVNGLPVDQYVLSLQNKEWLAFDARLRKVYRPELFAVSPGLGQGWQVRFELPGGADIAAEIPKIYGPKIMYTPSFYDNAHCVELNAETGYIRIFSFEGDIAKDFAVIQAFMQKSQGRYKKLIIDIRGNGGGSPVYFMDNLIAPLIKEPVVYEQIGALRRKFAENMQEQLKMFMDLRGDMISEAFHCINWEELPEAPGLDAADWRIFQVTRRIEPQNSFPFDGRVYLLTDPYSYSASDDCAETMKSIGLAKIVGTNTSGGAAHFLAPIYMTLPESGILFRLEMELALNPDGTPEEIFGTSPDVWLPEVTPGNSWEREDLLQDPWVQWVMQDTNP